MTKKEKKVNISKSGTLKVVNPDSAGIDVGSRFMQVCVPSDRCENNNRSFPCYTDGLRELASWLKECGIKTVAMESTGVYWVPLYRILEQDGFDVVLANAKAVKNISGRKTDVSDAEWLMVLMSYNLVTSSFQIQEQARAIRHLSRHRENLIRQASAEALHMQKAMERMNIKLHNAISDIMGVSGMNIISAIIDGCRDPRQLAQLADPRCRSSRRDIERSLCGTWDESLLFELGQSFSHYHYIMSMIRDCDDRIEAQTNKLAETQEKRQPRDPFTRACKSKAAKNKLAFDLEVVAYRIFGVNAMSIPSVSEGTVLTLLAELGADFTEKFKSARAFCHWCNLTPNNTITGGRTQSSHIEKRKNRVGQAFRQCASTLHHAKNELGQMYRRIKAQSGAAQANVAMAHKLAKIFFNIVLKKQDYDASILARNEQVILEKRIQRSKKQLEKLMKAKNQTSENQLVAANVI